MGTPYSTFNQYIILIQFAIFKKVVYLFAEMSEWLNVLVSKIGKVKAFGGSNPPLCAISELYEPQVRIFYRIALIFVRKHNIITLGDLAKMINYVFFDLDETLIDIKKAQNEAIKSLFKKFGFNKNTNLKNFTKKWDDLTDYHYKFYTAKEISYEEQRRRRIVDLFQFYNIELSQNPIDTYNIYLTEFENAWSVFDDVIESLQTLKSAGYNLGLISNGDYSQQVQKMQKVGIFELFSFVNTSSQFEYSKPNLKIFETVFKLHEIDFNQVVYIGDSYEKDILPCRDLGISAILIDRKNIKYDDNELIKVSSLNAIPELLLKLNNVG